MENSFNKLLQGYKLFREKYAKGNHCVMRYLFANGQHPETMVVACCDSRVDPALILQTDPGELFVVRNVANIVPPYEKDETRHGTSAALEFGICFLKVKNLILLGHSQCGGIHAWVNHLTSPANDFINQWVSVLGREPYHEGDVDACAKSALLHSYRNCLTFPWIQKKLEEKDLSIHLWFFDIKSGQIFAYRDKASNFEPLT